MFKFSKKVDQDKKKRTYFWTRFSFLCKLSNVQNFTDEVDPYNEFFGAAASLWIHDNQDGSVISEVSIGTLGSLRSVVTL